MDSLISWLGDNGTELVIALFAIHGAAVAITNLTPTPKDNEVVAKSYRWIEILAGIITKKAKQ